MGLDQYLTAERRFDPFSDDASRILVAAGVTTDELERLSKLDPMEHETSLYLPRWEHMRQSQPDVVAHAEAVVNAAGLLDFATSETGGSNLGWRDGQVVVDINAIYWRKSNQIHAWFVDNCQGGVDDCAPYPVHPEQLALLRSHCQEILDAKFTDDNKTELLPTRPGFFFGGTEYDEWYYQDLEVTVAEIDRVLSLAASTPGVVHLSYRSSW